MRASNFTVLLSPQQHQKLQYKEVIVILLLYHMDMCLNSFDSNSQKVTSSKAAYVSGAGRILSNASQRGSRMSLCNEGRVKVMVLPQRASLSGWQWSVPVSL